MGYRCCVSLEHFEGRPVQVVTKVRNVRYRFNDKETVGKEIVQMRFVSPENVSLIGTEPTVVKEEHLVDCRTLQRERRPHHEEVSNVEQF